MDGSSICGLRSLTSSPESKKSEPYSSPYCVVEISSLYSKPSTHRSAGATGRTYTLKSRERTATGTRVTIQAFLWTGLDNSSSTMQNTLKRPMGARISMSISVFRLDLERIYLNFWKSEPLRTRKYRNFSLSTRDKTGVGIRIRKHLYAPLMCLIKKKCICLTNWADVRSEIPPWRSRSKIRTMMIIPYIVVWTKRKA